MGEFMKLFLKEKGALVVTFIFFYLLIEYITFAWVDFSAFPQSFFVDFLFALGVGTLAFLFKSNKAAIIYLTIILAFVMSLFLINATMYSVYFDLFTLQQLTLLGEARNVFQFDFLSVNSIIVAIVIAIAYFIVLRILWKKMYRYYEDIPRYYKKAFIVLSFVFLFIFTAFSSGTKIMERFVKTSNVTTFKRASLEEYGILGYYFKEAQVIVLGNDISDFSENQGEVIPVEDSLPSEYFGFLENANIITIMVESLQPFAVNEVLTPNLYKMTQEGLYFPNHYSENKTNVSELIGITGNFPSTLFLPKGSTYDFPYSLPTVLSEDYRTAFFHDNNSTFYSRGNVMPMVGFEEYYFHNNLFPGVERWSWNGDYTLDSVTIEKVMEFMFSEEDPYYYFWSTLSMHGPYNSGPENKLLFEELGYFALIDQAEANGEWGNILAGGAEADRLRLRHYQAAVMDFDKALGRLLEELEDKNLVDDTIIVLYGDHNVYYHDLQLMINNTSASEFYNMNMYKSFFSIYNPLLTEAFIQDNDSNIIEKFVSPYNIVPTLYDLLGITYNQNLFLGESVFLDTNNVFYSHKLTGFFDDIIYSNDGYDILYFDQEVSEEYIQEFLADCEEQIRRLEIIDYWYDITREGRN